MDTDRWVLETTQPATIAHRPGPAPSSLVEQTDQSAKHNVKPTSRPEQTKSSTSSGIKRDARAAGLPDDDEQDGRFQQVEGLTTVNAAEIPCEFSVKDDLVIDEHAEGVDEEIAKAIVAGKKNDLHAMEAFGIFDVCEELPNDAKVQFRKVTSGNVGSQPESSDMTIQTWKDSTPQAAATSRLVDMHAQPRTFNPVPRCREFVLPW